MKYARHACPISRKRGPVNKAIERIPEEASNPLFEFFGLRANPFGISPDPRFLCVTPLTEAASQQLLEGVCQRKGLILLTGEVGTGKTLLLHRLLDWLRERNMPTALLFNSRLNADDLLDLVLSDFGVACQSSLKSDKLILLHRWLLDQHRHRRTPVLMVDEAQGLPLRTLEEIRLLLNLETPRAKLLQVVLAGQPELEEKLKRHELRQLRQRITVRCRTAPLTLHETHSYIQERLRVSGAKERIFLQRAAAFVHAYSQGIPRVINVLCEHSLINACADNSRVVDPRFVEQAAKDCQLEKIDAVGRAFHTSHTAGDTFGDIGSICAAVMPDSAGADDVQAAAAAVLTEAPPLVDLEAHVPVRDFGSGQLVLTLEAQPALDCCASPNTVILTETRAACSPTLQEMDIAHEGDASSVDLVQGRPSESLWQRRSAQRRGRLSRGVASLFQGWWRSFSADARSTRRQLHRLRQRCTLPTNLRLLRQLPSVFRALVWKRPSST